MKKTNLQAETKKSPESASLLSELAANDTRVPANYDPFRRTFLRKPNSVDLEIRIISAKIIGGPRTKNVCECGAYLSSLRDGSDQDNAFVCPICGLRYSSDLQPNE